MGLARHATILSLRNRRASSSGIAHHAVRHGLPQPVELAGVLRVIDMVVEVYFTHLEKCRGGQERVRPSLVRRPDAQNLQNGASLPSDAKSHGHEYGDTIAYPEVIGDLLQAAFEVVRRTHHVFNVVHCREPHLKELKKCFLGGGKGGGSKELDEIAKVVATVQR